METLLSMRCLMIRDTSTNLHTGNLAEHAPFGGKEHGKLYKGSAAEHAMPLEKSTAKGSAAEHALGLPMDTANCATQALLSRRQSGHAIHE